MEPPTPPPPPPQFQPIQQDQLNQFVMPLTVVPLPPEHQLSFQFPFNSVPDQNPNPIFVDDGSSSAAAGAGAGLAAGAVSGAVAGAKKKRGRPRKNKTDGNNVSGVSATQIPVNQANSGVGGVNEAGSSSGKPSSKKVRGRPPGKKTKKEALGTVGYGFTPYVMPVHTGDDIASKIVNFSLQGPPVVCILTATGVVSSVTLKQAVQGGDTVTYEGRFNIISLGGSFSLSEINGNRTRTGGIGVALSGPDGRVLGGIISGMLIAATPGQLVLGTFTPEKENRVFEAPCSTPPTNVVNVGAPVAETNAPSPGASSKSVDENVGSPLINEAGLFGDAAQTMHNAAQTIHNDPQPMHGMSTYWGHEM